MNTGSGLIWQASTGPGVGESEHSRIKRTQEASELRDSRLYHQVVRAAPVAVKHNEAIPAEDHCTAI